jgi:hypothetical protein
VSTAYRTPAAGIILTAALISLIGCTALAGCTTLAPGSADVRVTSRSTDVQHCAPAGPVTVPFSLVPVNYIGLATNQVVALQGDTLLVTVPLPGLQGVAYRCRG